MSNINEAIREANQQQGANKHGYKRPTYETAKDRQNQLEIASVVAAARGCQVQAMKAHSAVDFAAVHAVPSPDGYQKSVPAVRFWFEVKHRDIAYGQYKTLILSLHKWMDGYKLAKETGKPFVFFVRFEDNSIYFIVIDKTPAEMDFVVAIGGRASRVQADGTVTLDPNDIEPVVHIPMTAFKPLTTKPQ